MRSLNEHLEALNELSLETYARAIQKAQGRGTKQQKNIEKLALELIKRGETEEVRDGRSKVHKIELPDGAIEYRNEKGEYHREDGPAFINGVWKEWRFNGELHREDGPAFIKSDYKSWWINGKLHREDGPAIIEGDYKAWWVNGKLHREDGPAIIDGDMKAWWINGKQYTEKEFNDYLLKNKKGN